MNRIKEVLDGKILQAIIILLIFSVSLHAHNDVTKFLGIPVDGSKTAMIQRLKAKGFRYNNTSKCLEGEFNGQNVNIRIATNNNKVCRIMVSDANPVDEVGIKIRFNKLCRQFQNNPKYTSAFELSQQFQNDSNTHIENNEIPDDEDISYEILVNKKRYEAIFFQNPENITSAIDSIRPIFLSKYSEEQWSNPDMTEEIIGMADNYVFNKYIMKTVWFMIDEYYGKYYINMFYDNEYNRADGEDL